MKAGRYVIIRIAFCINNCWNLLELHTPEENSSGLFVWKNTCHVSPHDVECLEELFFGRCFGGEVEEKNEALPNETRSCVSHLHHIQLKAADGLRATRGKYENKCTLAAENWDELDQ